MNIKNSKNLKKSKKSANQKYTHYNFTNTIIKIGKNQRICHLRTDINEELFMLYT